MLITPHLLLVICIVLCVFSVNSNHQKPKKSNWCLVSLDNVFSIQLLMIIWTAMDVWSPEFITGPYWGDFMEPSSYFLCQIWFPLRFWFIWYHGIQIYPSIDTEVRIYIYYHSNGNCTNSALKLVQNKKSVSGWRVFNNNKIHHHIWT